MRIRRRPSRGFGAACAVLAITSLPTPFAQYPVSMLASRSHKRPPASTNRRVQYIGRRDPKRPADDPNAPHSDAQQRFVTAYLANGGNGTRAATTAGYSPRSTASTASTLLRRPKVERTIREARLKSLEHLHSEAEDVLRELVAIAHMDPRDVVTWGPDGIALKDSANIPAAAARAVSKVTQRISPGGTVTIEGVLPLED